ncbi:MAG: DUF2065 domain-containing protein [Jhaorihella sp.]
MAIVVLALGLVLIVEGLVWAVAPGIVERLLEALRELPEPARRQVGALALVAGVTLVWIAFRLGA